LSDIRWHSLQESSMFWKGIRVSSLYKLPRDSIRSKQQEGPSLGQGTYHPATAISPAHIITSHQVVISSHSAWHILLSTDTISSVRATATYAPLGRAKNAKGPKHDSSGTLFLHVLMFYTFLWH
jgi:hypothetical protein